MSWKNVSLESICNLLSGNAWSASKFSESGEIPIIRIQNLGNNENEKFIWWNEEYDPKFIITKGDLLLSLSGSIKVDVWNGVDALLNQRIVKLSPHSDIDSRWFYWQIQNIILDIERMGKWALVNNVSISDLKNVQIPLPPLPIQKRIAEILDAADALRKKDQELLKKYDELAQSIFIDMFGDPVKNEKGWDVKLLEEVIEMKGGGTPNTKRDDYYNGEIPWVSPKDMKSTYIQNSIDTISELAVQESSTNMIPENSVLMVVRSGILKKTLPVAINTVPVAINQDMKAFLPTKYFTAEFLLYFLKVYESQILQTVRGTTADNISSDVIKNINLFLPPIARQNKFSSAVKSLFLAKDSIEKSTTELLFSSLISKAFSGELVS